MDDPNSSSQETSELYDGTKSIKVEYAKVGFNPASDLTYQTTPDQHVETGDRDYSTQRSVSSYDGSKPVEVGYAMIESVNQGIPMQMLAPLRQQSSQVEVKYAMVDSGNNPAYQNTSMQEVAVNPAYQNTPTPKEAILSKKTSQVEVKYAESHGQPADTQEENRNKKYESLDIYDESRPAQEEGHPKPNLYAHIQEGFGGPSELYDDSHYEVLPSQLPALVEQPTSAVYDSMTGDVQKLTNPPHSFMCFSIFTAYLCCFCIGICAVIKAARCQQAISTGDADRAKKFSTEARNRAIVALVVGLVIIVVYIIIVLVTRPNFTRLGF